MPTDQCADFFLQYVYEVHAVQSKYVRTALGMHVGSYQIAKAPASTSRYVRQYWQSYCSLSLMSVHHHTPRQAKCIVISAVCSGLMSA